MIPRTPAQPHTRTPAHPHTRTPAHPRARALGRYGAFDAAQCPSVIAPYALAGDLKATPIFPASRSTMLGVWALGFTITGSAREVRRTNAGCGLGDVANYGCPGFSPGFSLARLSFVHRLARIPRRRDITRSWPGAPSGVCLRLQPAPAFSRQLASMPTEFPDHWGQGRYLPAKRARAQRWRANPVRSWRRHLPKRQRPASVLICRRCRAKDGG